MGKVVIFAVVGRDEPAWEKSMKILRDAGHEVIDPGDGKLSDDEMIRFLQNADALFSGFRIALSGKMIRSARNLKIIGRTGIGVDAIDVMAATQEGIVVCNTAGSTAQPVADHVFGLMVGVCRRLLYLDRITRLGKGWEVGPLSLLTQISGKTIGVVGTGHIGKAVIKRARGFDMEILALRRRTIDAELIRDFSVKYLPLKDLLANADFVTLHVPLTEETTRLIGEEELRSMKKTAYLINTSRGSVVDEKALIRALQEGWLAGAGLDVFEKEPLLESELYQFENVVVTPHIAGSSPESLSLAYTMAAENIVNGLRGTPSYVVNPDVLTLPQKRLKLTNEKCE